MCTTMIITKGAAADGSMIVTHSEDDELADQRVVFVPAQDHEPGSMRPVLPLVSIYPRIVSNVRGPGYDTEGFPATEPLGEIPQVLHTYAYFDGNYGIMNEHNLMIGECTNGAKYVPDSVTAEQAKKNGEHIRLFYTNELSRVALERCTVAREAIELMGQLVDEYGYYSTGETLLVADVDEAWVFEVCAVPDNEYNAVWAAQMVPDGEMFVAANQFRIREIEDGRDDLMYSASLHDAAEKAGWWKPADGTLDWLETVSTGEYRHPYYSLRRVWRVMDRCNPDLGLSPWVDGGYTKAYPFSIRPNEKISIDKVFALYRDHYEGTQFDMTKGVAAGPFGDPHRFFGAYDTNATDLTPETHFYGAWERPISVFYQGFVYVNQARIEGPTAMRGIMWLGPDVAYTSCFAPFPAKVLQLPWSYQSGGPAKMDRQSAWWAFDFVGNWSRLNFQRMTSVDIIPLQRKLEQQAHERVAEWDALIENMPYADAIETITAKSHDHAAEVLADWWDLADTIVAKYANGYLNLPNQPPIDIGYPTSWLGHTNYFDGPTSYKVKF